MSESGQPKELLEKCIAVGSIVALPIAGWIVSDHRSDFPLTYTVVWAVISGLAYFLLEGAVMDATCPLCGQPAQVEAIGTDRQHFRCDSCVAEFVVNNNAAEKLAALGGKSKRDISEKAAATTAAKAGEICVISRWGDLVVCDALPLSEVFSRRS